MKRIMFFLIFLLLTAQARAGNEMLPRNWESVVRTITGHTLYLDTSDIENSETGSLRFWLITEKANTLHENGQYEIDCSTNLFTIHGRIFLERSVNETGAEVIVEPARITVKPSTSIETIIKRLCETLGTQPEIAPERLPGLKNAPANES